MMNSEPLSVEDLEKELRSAYRDEPHPQALARYRQLFQHISTEPGFLRSTAEGVLTWLNAKLSWDSRQLALPAGVRSVDETNYRLLYAADGIDLELMIESHGQKRLIEGEIIFHAQENLAVSTMNAGLIVLESSSQDGPTIETKCQQTGRFTLENVDPHTYTMHVLFDDGRHVEIDVLTIS